MFSNPWRSHPLLVLCVSTLVVLAPACSLYEGPSARKPKEMNKLGCLKDFGAKLSLYLEGKGEPEEIHRAADCAILALHTFEDLVRGESKDRFTAIEIRNFLQRYFLEDVTISDSLLKEFMRVKRALVGGRETDFTPADLKMAEALIRTARDVALRMQSVMPLTMERIKREPEAYVDSVAVALTDVGEILGRKIVEQNSTYRFDEMARLCDELVRVFKDSATAVDSIRGNLYLAEILKEILIAPYRPRDVVTSEEWRLIFQDGSRWAGNSLKFLSLNARHASLERGPGRERLAVVVNEGFDLLERAIVRHCPNPQRNSGICQSTPGVPIARLAQLIEEIEWDGRIGDTQLNKKTLQALLGPIIQRVLGGTDPSETGRTATRFTVSHLARLRGLFQDWIDGARYVEGVYATLARSSDFPADATVATKALVALSPSVALRKYGGGSVQALAVAKGLRSSLANSIPLADKNSRSAIFDGKNSSRPRAYAEAMRFTWLRPVLKRVVLGYIEGDQHAIRAKNVDADGLRSEEFTQVAVDIWPILKDFKYVGRRNVPEEDAEKRFREAALFASGSDGNDIFSVDEGVQLVLLMLSAGPLATDFRIRIEAICQNGELDDYARPSIEPVCYRRTFYDFSRRNTRMADLWEAFPRLIDFYEGLSEERKAEFAGYVEIASRKPGYDESTWFASDESQTTVMLFHYMENLLARFDSSKDGNVDQDEAKSAFPIFRTTLAPVANLPETDAKLESVFTWLLAKGGPPVSDDMNWFKYGWKSGAFLSWHWRSPDFTADRLALMRVFATLMSALSPPPPAEAPAPAQR